MLPTEWGVICLREEWVKAEESPSQHVLVKEKTGVTLFLTNI